MGIAKMLSGAVGAMTLLAAINSGARAADPILDDECKKPVHVKFYGQANRSILFADTDGVSEVFLTDNDNSSSRVGVKAAGHVNCDLSVGAQIELELESNPSNNVNFNQAIGGTAQDFELKERVIDAYIKSNTFGKVTIGQGKMASDGTMEVNLSGTTVITSADQPDFMGSLNFGIGGGALSAFDYNDTYRVLDGLARQDRIRYDTPTIAGFSVSSSYSEDDDWDLALRFAREFSGVKFAAAAYYGNSWSGSSYHSGRTFDDTWGGSASVLLPFGLNATVAYAERDWATAGGVQDGFTGKTVYAQLGYIANIFDFGHTAFAVDYGYGEDHFAILGAVAGCLVTTCSGESYGAYVVQDLLKGVEAYAGLRIQDADVVGVNTDEVFGVMSGLRVKF